MSFANTSHLVADGVGYEPAFVALRRTVLGHKYGISTDGTSGKVYVSTESMRTINVLLGLSYDNIHVSHVLASPSQADVCKRTVHWILWSSAREAAF